MTTIAYRDGVSRPNTQVTGGNMRLGKVVKVRKRGRLLAGASGTSPVCYRWLDWFSSGCEGEAPSMKDEDGETSEGFIVMPDDLIVQFTKWGAYALRGAPWYASGSGEDLAITAMACGKTAEEAVRVAHQIDVKTGGEITVLRRETTAESASQ